MAQFRICATYTRLCTCMHAYTGFAVESLHRSVPMFVLMSVLSASLHLCTFVDAHLYTCLLKGGFKIRVKKSLLHISVHLMSPHMSVHLSMHMTKLADISVDLSTRMPIHVSMTTSIHSTHVRTCVYARVYAHVYNHVHALHT